MTDKEEREENELIHFYQDKVLKLEEENERLKKQLPILENRICSLKRKNASLERKVEKMKCCANCKLHNHECLGNGKSCKNWEYIKEN